MAERIVLKGRAEMLKPIITEILAIHQLIENRDIGEFCGSALEDVVKAKPQPLKIKILFYSVSEPPWRNRRASDNFVRATYNIPFINRTRIDWATIKAAAGGSNGYMWGRYRATAGIVHDGALGQMQIHGSTESEAEQRLKALAALSEGKIVSLSTTEEKKEGESATNPNLRKETTRVYPAYFTIVHSEKVITEAGRSTLRGKYKKDKFRIPLWTESKPNDADEIIREALRVRGSQS